MPSTNELLQEGRYRIGQPAPGKSNVYEAYDTVRNTHVIVREIPVKLNKVTTVSQQESLRLAFANQAKALTDIDHIALPHVHDFFSEIDRQYLVMDPVSGEDLVSMMNRTKRAFSVSQVTGWADQLLDALNYLHTHRPSIVHRNIRPQNINLDPSGEIKLLGVGLDGASEGGLADDGSNLRYSPIEQIWPGLDPASQKAITNCYDDRSERILKEPLDARSDIYSLGATLYFLMTGQEPVDPLERSIDILEGKLDPLREPSKVDRGIPAEISDVLMKALEIKRENRYDSAMIMRQVLNDAIARVRERQEEGDRQPTDSAEILRSAALVKDATPVTAADDAARHAEAEQKRLHEEQLRQSREAQEKERLAREAAEKERLAREAQEKERLASIEKDRLAREAEEKARQDRKAEEDRQRQLREAEEQRLAAERKAEADRLLQMHQQDEASRREAGDERSTTQIGAHLLDIPASAEVAAYREENAIDEAELAAVLEEIERAEATNTEPGANTPVQHVGNEIVTDEGVQTFDDPVDMAPSYTATDLDEDDHIFSAPQKSGSSLPMPAIAGGIVLVLLIAVGGWLAMSGSNEPEKPATAVQPVQVTQPPPESIAPVDDAIESTQTQSDASTSTTEPPNDQPVADARTATAPVKTKKGDPPKTEKKKAVTVDDLINDN